MYIIDRFEGDCAVIEDENRKMHKILKHLLPADVKEGDCIKKTEQGYCIDREATKQRKERIRKLMGSLFED